MTNLLTMLTSRVRALLEKFDSRYTAAPHTTVQGCIVGRRRVLDGRQSILVTGTEFNLPWKSSRIAIPLAKFIQDAVVPYQTVLYSPPTFSAQKLLLQSKWKRSVLLFENFDYKLYLAVGNVGSNACQFDPTNQLMIELGLIPHPVDETRV